MKRSRHLAKTLSLVAILTLSSAASGDSHQVQPPDTGIGGVYEVMVGTDDASKYQKYFGEFGFRVVGEGRFTAEQAEQAYGVRSALTSYRLQNGDAASHGLLRILEWSQPLGGGVGYAPPETIGQRMAVMRTEDIFRLVDVYRAARESGQRWLALEPVWDDLYGMSDKAADFYNRPVGVRETAVYGELFNHVFFQRYGYRIPGYGTVAPDSALATSEFTHHDFVIGGGSMAELTDYYRDALGLRDEGEIALDGDWQPGPQRVFDMAPGTSHWYRGFVSPNNICGKLKFFIPTGPRPDRSARQRPGENGITLHSLFTPKLDYVRELVMAARIEPRPITENEFGERSFVFTGPDGSTWQIIERKDPPANPVTNFELQRTGG